MVSRKKPRRDERHQGEQGLPPEVKGQTSQDAERKPRLPPEILNMKLEDFDKTWQDPTSLLTDCERGKKRAQHMWERDPTTEALHFLEVGQTQFEEEARKRQPEGKREYLQGYVDEMIRQIKENWQSIDRSKLGSAQRTALLDLRDSLQTEDHRWKAGTQQPAQTEAAKPQSDSVEAAIAAGDASMIEKETAANSVPDRDMLTIEEAAAHANVTTRTIRNWIRSDSGNGPMLEGVIGTGRLTRIPSGALAPYRKPVRPKRQAHKASQKRSKKKAVNQKR